MTPGGWIVMILSVGGATALLAWCLYKVLSTPGSEQHLHGQVDMHTPDMDSP
ncbi:MAG: hypothetical protein GYA33_11480 [Thermogutta sp.]|nr:hypothetical protein [Thermogutta sp.]